MSGLSKTATPVKGLGLLRYAELRGEERRPGAAQSLSGRPLDKRIAKDDSAVAAEIERAQKFANGRVPHHFRRAPWRNVHLAQVVEDRIRVRKVLAHGVHLVRKVLPIEIQPAIAQKDGAIGRRGGRRRAQHVIGQALSGIDDPDVPGRASGTVAGNLQQTAGANSGCIGDAGDQRLKRASGLRGKSEVELERLADALPAAPDIHARQRKHLGYIDQDQSICRLDSGSIAKGKAVSSVEDNLHRLAPFLEVG